LLVLACPGAIVKKFKIKNIEKRKQTLVIFFPEESNSTLPREVISGICAPNQVRQHAFLFKIQSTTCI
jgi:hypothetical protein